MCRVGSGIYNSCWRKEKASLGSKVPNVCWVGAGSYNSCCGKEKASLGSAISSITMMSPPSPEWNLHINRQQVMSTVVKDLTSFYADPNPALYLSIRTQNGAITWIQALNKNDDRKCDTLIKLK